MKTRDGSEGRGGQTVVEKIAQRHDARRSPGDRAGQEALGKALHAGDFLSVRPRHVMTHDNTAAVLNKYLTLGAERVFDPGQPVFTLDHDIQNRSDENLGKYARIEAFAAEQGIDFHAAGEGIGHQLMVERGYVLPGSFVVASDSHSNMYGALGAIGTPVVRTDAAAIWATGEFWWQIPRTVQVVLEGELAEGVTGKDVILTLCGLYGRGEVLNAVVEFSGPGVGALDLASRLTISNMTTEWGALVGWFPADSVTFAYLRERRQRLGERAGGRLDEATLAALEAAPPRADENARYAGRIVLDLARVSPHVAGPDSVQVMTSLAEMERRSVPIQKAYLVSCTNSRLEDLRAAASVVAGKRVDEGVEFYVAAASREIQERAEHEGVWGTLVEAGAHVLPPGCGPCIGLGTGLLEAGEVGISATNRNFKGRMGSRDACCYLASPEVVAASALAGRIRGPRPSSGEVPDYAFETLRPAASEGAGTVEVEIQEGFPGELSGRLVFLPEDNINTDGIYGKSYTYRDDMTAADMAHVVMENYDPGFVPRVSAGDICVGGYNFGTGSSREQAVTALQAKGIPLVVAGSFSQTYLRNAFNNGFVCIACPELVDHLREALADELVEGVRTLIPGGDLTVDFVHGRLTFGDRTATFTALGEVPQSLVVAGGVENLVRNRLALQSA